MPHFSDGVNVPTYDAESSSGQQPSIRKESIAAPEAEADQPSATWQWNKLGARRHHSATADIDLHTRTRDTSSEHSARTRRTWIAWQMEALPPSAHDEQGGVVVEEPDPKRIRLDDATATEMPVKSGDLQAEASSSNQVVKVFDYEKFVEPPEQVQQAFYQRFVFLTHKEQKALDKDIPWHMIPVEHAAGFNEALSKDLQASAAVEEPVDPARILATRVCYRNKKAAYPWMPFKYKALIACHGDADPDITTLRRDAPTLTRLALISLMVLLQLAASMEGRFIFNSDVTGAFLQGDQKLASRKEARHLRQPQEGQEGLPGFVKGQLLFHLGQLNKLLKEAKNSED